MSTGGNEWIAWVMLCVSLRTSITSRIHMEATVTKKICISLHCTTTERIMWHAAEESCWTWILPLEYEHLCPWRANFNGSVLFPSEAPQKRFIQSLTSHLDGPEVRGWGCRDSWRGLHSSSLFCFHCPCCFGTLLFLCKKIVLINLVTAWVCKIRWLYRAIEWMLNCQNVMNLWCISCVNVDQEVLGSLRLLTGNRLCKLKSVEYFICVTTPVSIKL